MVTTRCKSKNPATCRYHSPSAARQALTAYVAAEKNYTSATTLDEKNTAKEDMGNALAVYDATDPGFSLLKGHYRNSRIEGNLAAMTELSLRLAKAKIARSEEKQHGTTTDVVFLERTDLQNKVDNLKTLIGKGNSDHFYDVLDKYENPLKDAVYDYDTYQFTKTYNRLVDELVDEGNNSRWLDVEDGRSWVRDVNKTRITGKVHRTAIPLNEPHASSTFEA